MMKKTSGTLTRAEVAKAFGKDKSWVIRQEAAKKLVPVAIGKRNARLYDEQDIQSMTGGRPVERLPKAQAYVPAVGTSSAGVSAQVAAKVITRLAAGATPLEVLAEFELHAETVEELDAARIRLVRGLSLTAEHLDELESVLGLRPQPGDPVAFVDLMRKLADNLVCVGCSHGKASYCDGCLERYARNKAIGKVQQPRTNAAVGDQGRRQSSGAGPAARSQVSPPRRPPPQVAVNRAGQPVCDGRSGAASPAKGAVTTPDTAEHSSSHVRGGPSSTAMGHPAPAKGTRPGQAIATASGADVGSFNASQGNGAPEYAQPQGRPDDAAALNAATQAGTFARRHENASIDDLVSPIKLDPNDPDFLEKEALVRKHELDVLTRLLAESPLSAGDRIAFEKERLEAEGDGEPFPPAGT